MRRVLALFLCIILTAGISACGDEKEAVKEYTYEIAMITPSEEESVNDGADIENTWEGIRKFAEENGKTYKYYEPADESEEAGIEAVAQASDSGAAVVLGWGSETGRIFEKASERFPDLTFILVNGEGKTGVSDIRCDSAAAGYLAGYAAVTEGYEEIGFLGESRSDLDFGLGFTQGCNAAAVEWGHVVSLRFICGEKNSSAEQAGQTASQWYEEGTELIAVAGRGIKQPVETAAEKSGGKVICRSAGKTDEIVIAATTENCALAAEFMLKEYYAGSAEEHIELGVSDKAVALKWRKEQFSLFVEEDYQKVLERFADDEIKLLSSEEADSPDSLISEGNLYRIILRKD